MKIKIVTIISLFLTVVSVAQASDTTIINDVTAISNTGGQIVGPGESITTGDSYSEVYVETKIDNGEPTIIHEINTDDDNSAISITQVITENETITKITTSTETKSKQILLHDVKAIVEKKDELKTATTSEPEVKGMQIDKNQKIDEAPEQSTFILSIINWFTNIFTKLFT